MDSYEGKQVEPLSLHKYVYVWNNPVNHIDPSGHDLGDVLTTMAIGANVGAMANVATAYAKGQAITTATILQGAALGAAMGPFAAEAPAVFGAFGAGYGYGTFAPVLLNNNATCSQKITASAMIVAGFWGTQAGLNYNSLETRVPISGSGNPPLMPNAVPNFPLPLRAPPGVNIRSMAQAGLDSSKVWQIPSLMDSMATGKAVPYISGLKSGNTYWVFEGHTRITAALTLYNQSGNATPVMNLLNEGNFGAGVPTQDCGPITSR